MIKSFKLYFLSLFSLSLLASAFVYLSIFSKAHNWMDSFYPFGFLLTGLYFYFYRNQLVIDLSSKWNRREQFFSFFAMTVLPLLQFAKNREMAWIFMAYLPFYQELMNHLETEAKWVKEKKTMYFQFFLVTSMLFLIEAVHYWHKNPENYATFDFLSHFSYALLALPFFMQLKVREEARHLKLTKKFHTVENQEARDSLSFTGSLKEQKFFYHDLINKTYGMNLFLSEKLRQGPSQGINYQDLIMLQKEVQSMQTMIKDHAEINHRSIAPVREWVSFLEFRPKITHLARTYFSHKQVILQENYPKIDGEIQNFMVHAPSFERALGNLFKNAYEANSSRIEIVINISERDLIFVMKNDLQQIPESSFQLADRLSRNIERVDLISEEGPLGLESIHFLIERMNGKFSFGKEGEYWVSRLTIPNTKVENLERGRIPKESVKKVAA